MSVKEKRCNINPLQKVWSAFSRKIPGGGWAAALLLQSGLLAAQPVFQLRFDLPVFMEERPLPSAWYGGMNSAVFNRVDLDGDGSEELVVYDRSANSFMIFRYTINRYSIDPGLNRLLPQLNPGWMLWIDYDGDGRKDLFSSGDRGVIVHRNLADAGEESSWAVVADPLRTTGFSGKINLIANPADVPGIADLDGDGDYDILVYNFAIGGYIRYNRNYSMELYGHADSLEFVIETREWGGFEECDCNLFAFSPLTCPDIIAGRVMHPGGKALLAFDNDGDGDLDLLVGHEQCEELYFFENTGTPQEAVVEDYSALFPNPERPANFFIFPAGFYLDLDGDGVQDLVVSPSVEENLEFRVNLSSSSWLYRNAGSDTDPEFEFVTDRFLQGDMVDIGERAVPLLHDLDGDGDLDLLVAANGYPAGPGFTGAIHHFENTGTNTAPVWTHRSGDFLGATALDLKNPRINLADLNGDGSPDLIYTGIRSAGFQVVSLVFPNKAGEGSAPSFDGGDYVEIYLPLGFNDQPEFFDIDNDGAVDLLVARQNGALEYHRNTGGPLNPSFALEDGEYLGIGRDFSLERINLSATVADLDLDGNPDLITTDSRGLAMIYYDFLDERFGAPVPFPLEVQYEGGQREAFRFDRHTRLAAGDVFGRGSQSLVAGTTRGGLQFLENPDSGDGNNGAAALELKVYPNPVSAGSGLTLRSNQNATVEILNLLGQQVMAPVPVKRYLSYRLETGHLRQGIYLIRGTSERGGRYALRIAVQP
jgi:hypothetical protein